MRIWGPYQPSDPAGTEAAIRQALDQLQLPASAARLWLASAAGRLDSAARWALDYDPELELATFEVHHEGRLVFGLDDWLPRVAEQA